MKKVCVERYKSKAIILFFNNLELYAPVPRASFRCIIIGNGCTAAKPLEIHFILYATPDKIFEHLARAEFACFLGFEPKSGVVAVAVYLYFESRIPDQVTCQFV